ncbi:hypothetical protein PPL_10876 [Heterostelium album PN500]|uniref:Uncharacterized protein n=1 Tax=Heterostelium pallidum (strain ATCC 26659 / Pp 5 / PN500) TaxID=670386 RepID=D3BS84_HETP5|nr:hypothetical protein PPL_10876 [Heterostelium album PN500]EFA75821.1 hypothetical protein PPL_10876 [Heterostelium album PN500]|eukprot:XP_020427955.1 hypothetical protein PPL_10876 [Heterostelium album PN500]
MLSTGGKSFSSSSSRRALQNPSQKSEAGRSPNNKTFWAPLVIEI